MADDRVTPVDRPALPPKRLRTPLMVVWSQALGDNVVVCDDGTAWRYRPATSRSPTRAEVRAIIRMLDRAPTWADRINAEAPIVTPDCWTRLCEIPCFSDSA